MSDASPTTATERYGWPRWLSVNLAAVYAGQLNESTIRKMISRGELKAHRLVRGRVAVDRFELDALAEAATTTPRKGRGRTK